MRLMQHMIPGLLSEPDYSVAIATSVRRPDGAVLLKSWDPVGGILQGAGDIIGGVADIVNAPGNNRTAQELAAQETMRAQLAAQDAAAARVANMQILKYVAGAFLVGLTIYLILR